MLVNWSASLKKFVKVFPHEYRRVLTERANKAKESGLHPAKEPVKEPVKAQEKAQEKAP